MTTAPAPLTGSAARGALRRVIVLVAVYLTISVLTLVAAIVLRNDTGLVNAAVWIRGSIVAITAALMLRFAVGASRGDSRHFLRLRIVSAIMVVAIVAILVLIPGDFPLWMKLEQATCGVVLLAVVILANRRRTRSAFAADSTSRVALEH
jgi:hypothetical protein